MSRSWLSVSMVLGCVCALSAQAPIKTRIETDATTVAAGAQLGIKCEVDGYPEPTVYWTKDNVRLLSNDRTEVTDTRLTILVVTTSDSGVYGCHARNEYTSHSSTVQINVQGLYIPAHCTDNPFFADCSLIVKSKFCHHEYYSRFCCKSCALAGQLSPQDLSLQADQSWSRKK